MHGGERARPGPVALRSMSMRRAEVVQVVAGPVGASGGNAVAVGARDGR